MMMVTLSGRAGRSRAMGPLASLSPPRSHRPVEPGQVSVHVECEVDG